MLYYYIGTYTQQLLFRLIIVSIGSIDILEVPNPSISSRKRIVAMRNTGRLQTSSETQA